MPWVTILEVDPGNTGCLRNKTCKDKNSEGKYIIYIFTIIFKEEGCGHSIHQVAE
jgi:hypothetical protein